MDGGTYADVSEDDPDFIADMELVRMAFPRKVLTLSQTMYALDRLKWLYDNRRLIGAIRCHDIPGMQRCFRALLPHPDGTRRRLARASHCEVQGGLRRQSVVMRALSPERL